MTNIQNKTKGEDKPPLQARLRALSCQELTELATRIKSAKTDSQSESEPTQLQKISERVRAISNIMVLQTLMMIVAFGALLFYLKPGG